MPLQPPTYTQIPNELIDQMDKLTTDQLKIAMALYRIVSDDWSAVPPSLTLSHVQTMTGLSEHTVLDGFLALVAMGFFDQGWLRKMGETT